MLWSCFTVIDIIISLFIILKIFIWQLQVNAAAEVIYDLVDPTANLIFGAVIDPSLSGQVSLSFSRTGVSVKIFTVAAIWVRN
jgi:cell division GTPase FtsZ